MTMQRKDSFSYRGKHAEAIAINPRFLFTPAKAFGIATAAWATSNWRGFWCDYTVDEMFVLSNLYLFSKTHKYPDINGKKAEEIPEYVRILERVSPKAKEEGRYAEGFPMQYRGIDYLYEYSGRIVLGVEPAQNKVGEKKYQKVYELLFEEGILIEKADITSTWRAVTDNQAGRTEEYWWESQDNNYSELINYALMGANSDLDR